MILKRVSNKNKEPDMLASIENSLKKDGIRLFTNENVDEDYLTLPQDLTEVPSIELGRYFNAFTQQKMWVRTVAGRARILLKEEERKLDHIKNSIYSLLPAKMSVKEKELKVSTDNRADKIVKDIDYLVEKLAMLNDYLDSIEDGIFNISREITRRTGDFKDDRTEHNLGRRGRK